MGATNMFIVSGVLGNSILKLENIARVCIDRNNTILFYGPGNDIIDGWTYDNNELRNADYLYICHMVGEFNQLIRGY